MVSKKLSDMRFIGWETVAGTSVDPSFMAHWWSHGSQDPNVIYVRPTTYDALQEAWERAALEHNRQRAPVGAEAPQCEEATWTRSSLMWTTPRR